MDIPFRTGHSFLTRHELLRAQRISSLPQRGESVAKSGCGHLAKWLQLVLFGAGISIATAPSNADEACDALRTHIARLKDHISTEQRSGVPASSIKLSVRALNVTIRGYNARCSGSAAGGGLGGNIGNTNRQRVPNLLETAPPFAGMQNANEQNRLNAERETQILDQAIQYERAQRNAIENEQMRGPMAGANSFPDPAAAPAAATNPFEQSSDQPQQTTGADAGSRQGVPGADSYMKRYCATAVDPRQCQLHLMYLIRPDPDYEKWKQDQRAALDRKIDAAEAEVDRQIAIYQGRQKGDTGAPQEPAHGATRLDSTSSGAEGSGSCLAGIERLRRQKERYADIDYSAVHRVAILCQKANIPFTEDDFRKQQSDRLNANLEDPSELRGKLIAMDALKAELQELFNRAHEEEEGAYQNFEKNNEPIDLISQAAIGTLTGTLNKAQKTILKFSKKYAKYRDFRELEAALDGRITGTLRLPDGSRPEDTHQSTLNRIDQAREITLAEIDQKIRNIESELAYIDRVRSESARDKSPSLPPDRTSTTVRMVQP